MGAIMPRRLREEVHERIIELLKGGPKTFEELQEVLQIPRRTLFRYLRILRDKGVVISLGRGRGYCLGDYEALRRYYQGSLSVRDVFPVIPVCREIVKGAVRCPSKMGKTKLAIKAQNILLYTLQIMFIQSILSASTRRDAHEVEKVVHYLVDAVSQLAQMNRELLRESRSLKLKEMLKASEGKILRKAFREVDSYAETVKRVASHLS
jgi:DNA-binding transcriptional ArsR family regulator